MKNYRETQEALLAGETLVNPILNEAFLDDDGNIIKPPSPAILFGFVYNCGIPSITAFTSEDKAVEYFKNDNGQVAKFQQVTE